MPEMWEMQVRSLDQKDPLEEEMANHSSILGWKIPRTEEPGGLQSMGSQKSQTQLTKHTEHTHTHTPTPTYRDLYKQYTAQISKSKRVRAI